MKPSSLLNQISNRFSAFCRVLTLALILVNLLAGSVALASEDTAKTTASEAAAEPTAEPASEPTAEPIPLTGILTAGPLPLPLPAFHCQEKGGVKADALFQALPGLPQKQWPQSGDRFSSQDGSIAWKKAEAPLVLTKPLTGAAFHYTAFYVTSDRWQKASLTVTGEQPYAATLDGLAVKLEKKDGQEGAATRHTGELTLPIGKHLVSLRTMFSADESEDKEAEWSLGLSVTPDAEAGPQSLTFSVDPERRVDIQLILDAPRIAGVDLSPDGKLAAVSVGEFRDGDGQDRAWPVVVLPARDDHVRA